MIDSTIVRAHQQAAAGRKKGGSENQALGRSRGGLSTQIHLLTDGFGQPLAFRLTPGHAAEQPQALPLLKGRKAEAVIADRGYDTRAIVACVQQMGAQVVIPSRSHWLVQRVHDRALYKTRNRIERCFSHLKQLRRLAFGNGQKLLVAAHDMGAHPALIWAADHPDEIACLAYMEVPTMLEEILSKVIVYTPEAMAKGSMWWWVLPLAPGVPERLIVGHERAFLTWFYDGATGKPVSITEALGYEVQFEQRSAQALAQFYETRLSAPDGLCTSICALLRAGCERRLEGG